MAIMCVYSETLEISKQLLGLAHELKENNNTIQAITIEEEQAEELIAFGADKVIVLKGENEWPESYAGGIAEAVKNEGADLFLIGDTIRGRDIAAQVAARLQTAMVSRAISVQRVEGAFETERMMYGGSVSKRERLKKLSLITIPVGKYEPVSKDKTRNGEVVSIEVTTDSRVSILEKNPLVKEGRDLTSAARIVCVGLGLDKREDLKLAEDLAAVLGADIACTRGIAEEKKWLPIESYIGLSGIQIKPDLYLSLGVSGQVQHVVGIRDSKIIAAIDNNENAPIFQVADYGIVGDLYEIVPLLIETLKK